MRYIDKYPNCIGCPVKKYCGTMVGSIRLCNSFEESKKAKSFMAVTAIKEMTPEEMDDYACNQIAMQLETM